MELRAGYKQTDIGVIPTDWDFARIVDVASITTGSRNTQDRIEDGAYPFFVRSQMVERIDSYSFDGEAVLTAGDGVGTGKIFHYINEKFDFHQRVYKMSNFSDRLIGYYFFVYFSNKFFDRIMSMTAKSSVDSVRREMIADMLIPLPPPPEQRAIAAALSDADALIASLDALIAKKRDLKQAAMQQLLTGKIRLPGFTGGWEVERFDAVLDRINVKRHQVQTSDYAETGELPIVDQGQVDVVGYTDRQEKRFSCPDGGVIVFGDHTCIVKFVSFDFVIGADGTQVLIAKPGNIARFYFYALQYQGVPSTGYNRHFKQLKERKFLSPPNHEQSAIADVLSDIDADLTSLGLKRDKARALKQGMMQELLTGRTRLV
jgi:type I restriction enzyme S subunit